MQGIRCIALAVLTAPLLGAGFPFDKKSRIEQGWSLESFDAVMKEVTYLRPTHNGRESIVCRLRKGCMTTDSNLDSCVDFESGCRQHSAIAYAQREDRASSHKVRTATPPPKPSCKNDEVYGMSKQELATLWKTTTASCLINQKEPLSYVGTVVRYNDLINAVFFYNKEENALFACGILETEECMQKAGDCEAPEACLQRSLCVQHLSGQEKKVHCETETSKTPGEPAALPPIGESK